MQRIIKFRAWDKVGGGMISLYAVDFEKGYIYFHFDKLPQLAGESSILMLNNCELMQFTGLLDKNGKECYWDDWVSDGINPKFLVTPDYHLLARLSEIEFEIVGNKYETR